MNMSNSEREKFASELIVEIAQKVGRLDIEACNLIAELKDFVIAADYPKYENTTDANVADTAMLTGVQFTKEEAYNMCQEISKKLCDICTRAEYYCWSFDIWYAMAEILKMFGIQPNNKFTSFINCFLAVNIDIENAKVPVDDSYKIKLMKKLEIIHLLGEPEYGKNVKTELFIS